MLRTSAGPAPSGGATASPTSPHTGPIRPGALSRAQQPAPKGAMQSGAASTDGSARGASDAFDGEDAGDDERRGQSAGRKTWQTHGAASDDEDAIGPLPKPTAGERTGSGDRRQRSSSRDSSFAKRLSAGLSGVLRGRSGSVERSESSLSRQDSDFSTFQGELNGLDAAFADEERGSLARVVRRRPT